MDMRMNMVGESGTRMDYLAELIENKYPGHSLLLSNPLLINDINNTINCIIGVFV